MKYRVPLFFYVLNMNFTSKNMKRSIYFFVIFFITSCVHNTLDQEYSIPLLDLESVEAERITGTPLFELIAKHVDIDVINNYFFVNTHDKSEGIVQIFNRSGKKITSFGIKGKGPQELLFGDNAGYDEEECEYWLFDLYQSKLIAFKYNIVKNDSIVIRVDRILNNMDNNLIRVKAVTNNKFIGTIYSKKGIFAYYDGNIVTPSNIFGDYPLPVNDVLATNLIRFQGDIIVDSDNKRLFFASSKIGYISSYSLKTFKKRWAFFTTRPVYKIKNGDIIFDYENHKDGFASIKRVDGRIYALYKGLSGVRYHKKGIRPGANMVLVFDEKGTIVGKYLLDSNIVSFCISSDKKYLFGVTVNENMSVVQYEL